MFGEFVRPDRLQGVLHFIPNLLRNEPRPWPVLISQSGTEILQLKRASRHVAGDRLCHVPDRFGLRNSFAETDEPGPVPRWRNRCCAFAPAEPIDRQTIPGA